MCGTDLGSLHLPCRSQLHSQAERQSIHHGQVGGDESEHLERREVLKGDKDSGGRSPNRTNLPHKWLETNWMKLKAFYNSTLSYKTQ